MDSAVLIDYGVQPILSYSIQVFLVLGEEALWVVEQGDLHCIVDTFDCCGLVEVKQRAEEGAASEQALLLLQHLECHSTAQRMGHYV